MGEDIESLSLKEVQNLEQQLDTGLKNIRTRKVRMHAPYFIVTLYIFLSLIHLKFYCVEPTPA